MTIFSGKKINDEGGNAAMRGLSMASVVIEAVRDNKEDFRYQFQEAIFELARDPRMDRAVPGFVDEIFSRLIILFDDIDYINEIRTEYEFIHRNKNGNLCVGFNPDDNVLYVIRSDIGRVISIPFSTIDLKRLGKELISFVNHIDSFLTYKKDSDNEIERELKSIKDNYISIIIKAINKTGLPIGYERPYEDGIWGVTVHPHDNFLVELEGYAKDENYGVSFYSLSLLDYAYLAEEAVEILNKSNSSGF